MILNGILDYVIVGAGITGCYLAWRLSNQNSELRILILERNSTYGGRLLSIPWDGIIAELGAWRYLSSRDVLVDNLVKSLGLTSQPLNLPRIKEPLTSPHVQQIIDQMPPDTNGQTTDDIAFIPYLYSQGATTKEILAYIDYLGYDIYRGDIEASLIRDPNGGYSYILEGYKSLCTKMLRQMNNNVYLQLNQKVKQVDKNRVILQDGSQISTPNLIVTVQPQHLAQIYPSVSSTIASSMIAYNAIRLWCKVDKDVAMGTYVFEGPLRKIYSLGNRRILIYVDGAYAEIVPQLLDLLPSLIGAKVVRNPKPIYKYWIAGIMFWRPKGERAIEQMIQNLPFTYMNGDVSDRPGWVEGSLQLVDQYLANK